MLRLPDDTKIEMDRDWYTRTVTLVLNPSWGKANPPWKKPVSLQMSLRKVAKLMLRCNEMLAGTGFDWDDREIRKKLGK